MTRSLSRDFLITNQKKSIGILSDWEWFEIYFIQLHENINIAIYIHLYNFRQIPQTHININLYITTSTLQPFWLTKIYATYIYSDSKDRDIPIFSFKIYMD